MTRTREHDQGPWPRDPREAVPALVDEHGGTLYALGMRFCGNAQDAEDLVQEVFLQAYRAWETFEGRSSVKTWLYTIAARVCQRMHRPRAGQPARMASLDELLPFGEASHGRAIGGDEASDGQMQREARERIERAITALPDDFRIPLILKEIVGFSVPEVAEILGLQEGTVKSRVHRARLRLRQEVEAVAPRSEGAVSPPAYSLQVCLDLLSAKQEAMDQGVAFRSEVICERCRDVFAMLDVAQEVCHDLGRGAMPAGLRAALVSRLKAG